MRTSDTDMKLIGVRSLEPNVKKLLIYNLSSRCTAIPHKIRRVRTTGMAAIVTPNSAEFLARTTMSS